MSATARILTGLASGALIGLLLAWFDPALGVQVADIVQPFGKLWLNALQMTVVPLVLALVIVGVNTATDAASSGRTARRAIIVFLLILSGAAAFTALVAPLALSLLTPDPGLAAALHGASGTTATATAPATWADSLTAMIPSNAIAAAAQSAMLPLVVFALFFGFALTRIDDERRAKMLDFFQAIADAMIVVVRWVLWAAPVGVFALILSVCARAGLVVQPSRYEGFPNVVLEAMAMGVPVAATDVGNVRELLDDGRCGVVLPQDPVQWPAQMAIMFTSEPWRHEVARQARKRIDEQYTFERRMERVLGVYDQLLRVRPAMAGKRRRAA